MTKITESQLKEKVQSLRRLLIQEATLPNPWEGKDPAKAAAWAKLSPQVQGKIGQGDPTDPIIIGRMVKGGFLSGKPVTDANPDGTPKAAPAAPAAPAAAPEANPTDKRLAAGTQTAPAAAPAAAPEDNPEAAMGAGKPAPAAPEDNPEAAMGAGKPAPEPAQASGPVDDPADNFVPDEPNPVAAAAPAAAPAANPSTGVNAQGQNVTINNPDGSKTNPETGTTTAAAPTTGQAAQPAGKWPTTPAEIKAFQKANGLTADGLIGNKTMAALQAQGIAPPAGFRPVGNRAPAGQGARPAAPAARPLPGRAVPGGGNIADTPMAESTGYSEIQRIMSIVNYR